MSESALPQKSTVAQLVLVWRHQLCVLRLGGLCPVPAPLRSHEQQGTLRAHPTVLMS